MKTRILTRAFALCALTSLAGCGLEEDRSIGPVEIDEKGEAVRYDRHGAAWYHIGPVRDTFRMDPQPVLTDADIAAAVDGAAAAYRDWSRTTTPDDRSALITKVAELHRERRQHLAEIIVREMGKPIGDSLTVDIPGAARALRQVRASRAASATRRSHRK